MVEQTPEQKVDEMRSKVGEKKQVDMESLIKVATTRDKLERDYFEDLLEVSFQTATGIRRMIRSKRPTQKQMLLIMTLSLQASIYEKLSTEQSIQKMTEIYGQLSNLAAELCEDKALNEEFWSNKVSFTTLQNFIGELIRLTQEGPVNAEELDSFRKK